MATPMSSKKGLSCLDRRSRRISSCRKPGRSTNMLVTTSMPLTSELSLPMTVTRFLARRAPRQELTRFSMKYTKPKYSGGLFCMMSSSASSPSLSRGCRPMISPLTM